MDYLEIHQNYTKDGCESLFDYMSEDEFVEYLNKKYNLKIKETIVSYHYIR